MACYNAITGLDPGDCLFKKQWEWEEVVRFHTPGWETRAGPQTADWRPLKALSNSAVQPAPATANEVRAQPAHQGKAANRGEPGEDPSVTVVDPTWDRRAIAEKKGKVIQEREKLMVAVHARRGGGLYFSIDQIIEDLWPQSAPDGPTYELLWDGLSAFGTGSWIYSTGERVTGGTRSSAGETDDLGSGPAPPELTARIFNSVTGIYNYVRSRRVDRFTKSGAALIQTYIQSSSSLLRVFEDVTKVSCPADKVVFTDNFLWRYL